MQPPIKQDLLNILEETLLILRTKEESDVHKLKELSNHIVHNASIFQDEDSISVAVIIYSVYKMIERYGLRTHIYDVVNAHLKQAERLLRKDDMEGYRAAIHSAFKFISKTDKRLKEFIQEVIDKARITKGSKVFEHGISITKAASLMGISEWELANYVGKTTIVDEQMSMTDVGKRLLLTRRLFGLR